MRRTVTDTPLIPIPGQFDPVTVPRDVTPREDGRVDLIGLPRQRIAGLFEHHTGELSQDELEAFLEKLIDGTITNQEVYDDQGHGALMFQPPGRSSV